LYRVKRPAALLVPDISAATLVDPEQYSGSQSPTSTSSAGNKAGFDATDSKVQSDPSHIISPSSGRQNKWHTTTFGVESTYPGNLKATDKKPGSTDDKAHSRYRGSQADLFCVHLASQGRIKDQAALKQAASRVASKLTNQDTVLEVTNATVGVPTNSVHSRPVSRLVLKVSDNKWSPVLRVMNPAVEKMTDVANRIVAVDACRKL
jgi:hypothetical protein